MNKQFRILEITEELTADILSRTYGPHLHDFEELILITQGSLTHLIDFKEETVTAPAACYISTGKLHKLIPNADLRGWVVSFKPEFIPQSALNFHANFTTSAHIPFRAHTCFSRLETVCHLLQTESKAEIPDMTTLRHLTSALIAMVDAERRHAILQDPEVKDIQLETFGSFLQILESNFHRNVSVSYYAGKLNMSERNLNLICRSIQQKSVSEIVETRRITEAKQQLLHSSKSISEIGFELGYSEKSYFSRVFHSRTGLTPSAFREQMRSAIS